MKPVAGENGQPSTGPNQNPTGKKGKNEAGVVHHKISLVVTPPLPLHFLSGDLLGRRQVLQLLVGVRARQVDGEPEEEHAAQQGGMGPSQTPQAVNQQAGVLSKL